MGKLTIAAAGRFAKAHDLERIVVVGVHADGRTVQVTSWGRDAKLCGEAKELADKVCDAIGFEER